MKKYCDCNNPGLTDYDNYDGMIIEDYRTHQEWEYFAEFDSTCYTPFPQEQRCPDCGYCFWYRAHEENMMFDLKSMNN